MTQLSYTNEQRATNVAKTLVALAALAALMAVGAGLTLLITDPASGSTAEAVLGVTAAVAGLSAAAFVIAALIYAQVKNLWENVPTSIRTAAWVIIATVVVFNLVRSLV